MINDVTVTEDGAWFTDSRRGTLFSVPVDDSGEPGEFRTLACTARQPTPTATST